MNIIQDLIPISNSNRPRGLNKMQYITIHNTGNSNAGAGAKGHSEYLKSEAARKAQVSWHYTTDDKAIYQHIPDNETAWHSGDGKGNGNMNSIGIEICMNSDGNLYTATMQAVALVAFLQKKYNIPDSNVVQHNKWSGKNCPQMLRSGKPFTWAEFMAKVAEQKKNDLLDEHGINLPKPAIWAGEAWQWAEDNGLCDGLRPTDNITRQEFVTLLFRYDKIFGK